MRAPLKIFGNQGGFAVAGADEPRRQADTPPASNADAEAHAVATLARWAMTPTTRVRVCHSSANRARLSSLSAIKSCFRDSSGLNWFVFPSMRGPFGVVREWREDSASGAAA